LWSRRNRELVYAWGLRSFEEKENPNPEFTGEWITSKVKLPLSDQGQFAVQEVRQLTYPSWKRALVYILVMLFLVVASAGMAVLTMLYGQWFVSVKMAPSCDECRYNGSGINMSKLNASSKHSSAAFAHHHAAVERAAAAAATAAAAAAAAGAGARGAGAGSAASSSGRWEAWGGGSRAAHGGGGSHNGSAHGHVYMNPCEYAQDQIADHNDTFMEMLRQGGATGHAE
jgi:hypothetical protein